jgi:hypothetical protein
VTDHCVFIEMNEPPLLIVCLLSFGSAFAVVPQVLVDYLQFEFGSDYEFIGPVVLLGTINMGTAYLLGAWSQWAALIALENGLAFLLYVSALDPQRTAKGTFARALGLDAHDKRVHDAFERLTPAGRATVRTTDDLEARLARADARAAEDAWFVCQ